MSRKAIALAVCVMLAGGAQYLLGQAVSAESSEYLKAALAAGEWLKASAVHVEGRLVWAADPADPASAEETLYAGVPGVVLYFLEAWGRTGSEEYLEYARGGADHLLSVYAEIEDAGLYSGLAGIGYVLGETHKATGERKYLEGALRCSELIRARAEAVGGGVEWGGTTDIIGGAAGTGLFLLWAARELGDEAATATAAAAGRRLLEVGIPAGGGLKWAMHPDYPRLMPNFAHGTAGVAYFLARLYEETGERAFLDGATAGADYLLSIAEISGGGCLIFHHEPEGEDLFYLGWCHGPVGTARLFYMLYRVTGEESWREWVLKSAESILASGIPERQTPGFWNNVGICCGSAGVARFFLDLYRLEGDGKYLEFCRRIADDMIARATPDGGGLKWIQAEHRSQPDLLIAQTGLMQGAAGIGLALLQMDGVLRGERPVIVLPDTSF